MGSSQSISVSNASVNARGSIVVVVGASQGIGRGVAARFAQAGAEVWIVVRNAQRGNDQLKELRSRVPSSSPQPRLFVADLNIVADLRRVVEEISTAAGDRGVDYLIQTQGGPPNAHDVAPNQDGFDSHFAVQVFSRVFLAYHLRDLVKHSSMAIMAAGEGKKPFNVDDITLEGSKARGEYGMFGESTSRDVTVIDSAWIELAKISTAQFTHLFPGIVRTAVLANSGQSSIVVWIHWLAGFVIGQTVESYAEIPFYLTANPEGRKLIEREGGWLNENLKKLAPSPASEDVATRQIIWSWLQNKMK
ncbi:NAD(P)-binding protein [Exidia glandulosa HHB12029]|uniref:NAD(P)-binding protein n=1 Tax=Exidia glandulosa HHB12029 TaxID=1314781 RepID=A0A165GDH0_EXIGL|nr:NAD(P)-binding protein [Exidia glandulosa HHB12029]